MVCLTILTLIFVFLLISPSHGRDFLVGGTHNSWALPLPSQDSLNRWAQNQRFTIGDSLLWKYDKKSESVLEVKEENYGSCNISDPVVSYNDGDTKVDLNRSGPFYFISGSEGHCQKGLKMSVVVLSTRHGGGRISSPAPAPAPSPPDSQDEAAPAPAPHSGGVGGRLGGGGVGELVWVLLWIAVAFVM
ncbi:early nodulin-like protein 1 [Senna tora]|uniref:Early nodulin-like protein 1 n=1 Tax=Senna tora TaxID=362788 RepID=A0A834SPG8_9FABA|nr:early nodulin-like protein 1 [Senna tora]